MAVVLIQLQVNGVYIVRAFLCHIVNQGRGQGIGIYHPKAVSEVYQALIPGIRVISAGERVWNGAVDYFSVSVAPETLLRQGVPREKLALAFFDVV